MLRVSVVFLILNLVNGTAFSQLRKFESVYKDEFKNAYQIHPNIPSGLLEAIAYNRTNLRNISASEQESCLGLPRAYGLFGLVEDGKSYFRNTLQLVSALTNFDAELLKTEPSVQIEAYALAVSSRLSGESSGVGIAQTLRYLSELPHETLAQVFALDIQTYEVLSLLNDRNFMSKIGNQTLNLNLKEVFGSNLELLSSKKILMNGEGIYNERGETYERGGGVSPCNEYAADTYVQTPTCNYSSRSGTPISAITVHTIQGTYAGAISWAQNCDANVSYHYVLSNTGQITQMLCETDKGWHVGTENPYTISIEHDGYVSNPLNYTPSMYATTADLCFDISQSGYGIYSLRTAYFPWSASTNYNSTSTPGSCIHIKGHQHFPNQTHTDPGQYWDWDYFYKLVNPNTSTVTLTSATGNFYDSGGQVGVYNSDERSLTLIQPTNASSVSVTFQSFDLEEDWDYLYIYDGTDVFSTLIGYYTGTNNPGTVTSNNGHLLFEFRSDCAITASGWEVMYESSIMPVGVKPSSKDAFRVYPNPTTGIVNLPQTEGLKWQLFDATGRLVAEGSGEGQVNLKDRGLAEQTYSLRLISEETLTILKLVFLNP